MVADGFGFARIWAIISTDVQGCQDSVVWVGKTIGSNPVIQAETKKFDSFRMLTIVTKLEAVHEPPLPDVLISLRNPQKLEF